MISFAQWAILLRGSLKMRALCAMYLASQTNADRRLRERKREGERKRGREKERQEGRERKREVEDVSVRCNVSHIPNKH